jgi:hypothetical protein
MPSHCPFSGKVQPIDKSIDYVSLWLPALNSSITLNPYANVTTQEEVDALVCNATSADVVNIPDDSEYTLKSGDDGDISWGVSVTGIYMYHGLNDEGVDPFYPVIYGNVTTEPENTTVSVDSCFSDTNSDGFMHYHCASSCIPDKPRYEN